jgi:hypothetical protein
LVSANAELVSLWWAPPAMKRETWGKKQILFFLCFIITPNNFIRMPTSLLYVHMMWANFVVKHNKVWNRTLDDLVSKVQDSSQHCHQTEGHHVGPRWNTFSLDALEYRNSCDAVWWKGKIEQAINDLKLGCMQKSVGAYDLKNRVYAKTKLQNWSLEIWVHAEN